jgi:hypothetical protein
LAWHPAQTESPTYRWRDLAARAGVEFYPEISWQELKEATRPRGHPVSDELYSGSDPITRRRVVEHLRRRTSGPFFFRYDLVASIGLEREPVVLVSNQLSLEAARAGAVAIAGRPDPIADAPEHWWPADRSWVVSRDFDLDELYIACDDELARDLMADSALEVVEVGLRSRVDWTVDDDRRGPSVT